MEVFYVDYFIFSCIGQVFFFFFDVLFGSIQNGKSLCILCKGLYSLDAKMQVF